MPIHDWTRVDAGIFHDFHHAWIEELKRELNRVLPPDFYALAEQTAGGPRPDGITLQTPSDYTAPDESLAHGGMLTVATAPPAVRFHTRVEEELLYAVTANKIAIRHRSGHEVIAMVAVVSSRNKSSAYALETFVEKSVAFLRNGIHLLIIDLFPPGPRDPQGIHVAIWGALGSDSNDFELPADQPLILASYVADTLPEAYVESVGVGDTLPDMPIFLRPGEYVPVPLEISYERAWNAVPAFWRGEISSSQETP